MKANEIITDEQLAEQFLNTHIGSASPRDIVNDTVLKIASGYSTGHTAICICSALGLLKRKGQSKKYALTNLGREYLYQAFKIEK